MHPGPSRLPGRGSQTLTCLKITLEQSIMAHQGVTSSNLGWGPEACIFNKHTDTNVDVLRTMLVYPNGIILELQPDPGRLVAFFFFFFFLTLGISQSVHALEPLLPGESPSRHPSSTGHFRAAPSSVCRPLLPISCFSHQPSPWAI